MPRSPEPLTAYLPRLAEISPIMRFVRMDDATLTPYALQSAAIYKQFCNLDAGVSLKYEYNRVTKIGRFPEIDAAKAVRTWRITVDHVPDMLEVLVSPARVFVMAFNSTAPGADGNPHPRRAFGLQRWYWNRFIQAVEAHLGVGKYPARRPDSEFKRGDLPYGALLRCVPDEANNVPVLTCIPASLDVFMTPPIYPPDKPVWRQVIRGGVQYWWRKP